MNLASYLGQFAGDDDPMAVCRERNGHNWYTAVSIFGRFAECRDCHVRVQDELVSNRINWLQHETNRLNYTLRATMIRSDYIAECRAYGQHDWRRLWGGLQCRRCGTQILFPEPFTTEDMNAATERSEELDADLRKF